ncbi:HEL077Wp [Eremothecium sinecaudum]|uniref:Non-structural maintenance of chromosomes element 1 homolog n=1 Tax=Eremothecium sinecaudum TaxID=45286 RepID=A0A0X8HTM5_9SACH|nr:HEL077Wp [Eremothecium sinecaudum]AMD21203.1 HEL077Wp [Eremothecium sinecaudum]
MSEEAPDLALSEDIRRLLLQVILRCQGIVHENVLLTCLLKLNEVEVEPEEEFREEVWLDKLGVYIADMNVKLSGLNYRIVKVGHGMGKNYVTSQLPTQMLGFRQLSPSNRFYVYVNVVSTKETELSTTFKASEIEFVKWAIEQLATLRQIDDNPEGIEFGIEREIDRILNDCIREDEQLPFKLRYWTTYTVNSMKLMSYSELATSEVERLLSKLCELKWFYKTQHGSYGLDLKALLELEDYLIETFAMLSCPSCQRIVTQGVLCTGCVSRERTEENGTEQSMWHVDCFEYYLNHVSKNCNVCESNLLEAGAYLV